MQFDRPTLAELRDRSWLDTASQLAPLESLPRYNILKVQADVEAGSYHQLYGDLQFLADQLFPDTAQGRFLRAHWSMLVPPKGASRATGQVTFTGNPGVSIPQGLVLLSPNGLTYYTESQTVMPASGSCLVTVVALDAGTDGNIDERTILTVSSAKSPGLDSEVTVGQAGIKGGAESETDSEYLTRVLAYIQTGSRYGKKGDFAAWAVDSSPEVKKAFEVKNYSIFGALLIQVIGGNQAAGVTSVTDLDSVAAYIANVAPPVLFTVKTPTLVPINPSVHLLPTEDNPTNRGIATACLLAWLDTYAKPKGSITPEQLRSSFVDGSIITGGSVVLPVSPFVTSALEYPTLGNVTWT